MVGTTEAERLELLRSLYIELVGAGDVSRLLAHLSDDAVYRVSVGPGTPLSGDWVGRAGVARYFATVPTVVELVGLHVHDFFAAGDKVVVTGDETLHVLRSGVTFTADWATVFTFRGLEICEVRVIENLAPLSDAHARPARQTAPVRVSH